MPLGVLQLDCESLRTVGMISASLAGLYYSLRQLPFYRFRIFWPSLAQECLGSAGLHNSADLYSMSDSGCYSKMILDHRFYSTMSRKRSGSSRLAEVSKE